MVSILLLMLGFSFGACYAAENAQSNVTSTNGATSGSLATELECMNEISSSVFHSQEIRIFQGSRDSKDGFYLMTSQALHFYPLPSKKFESCKNDREDSSFTTYHFQVKLKNVTESIYLHVGLRKTDLKDQEIATGIEKPPGKVCQIRDHETLDAASKIQMYQEILSLLPTPEELDNRKKKLKTTEYQEWIDKIHSACGKVNNTEIQKKLTEIKDFKSVNLNMSLERNKKGKKANQ